jgi:putative peptide maturation dehydrogenase
LSVLESFTPVNEGRTVSSTLLRRCLGLQISPRDPDALDLCVMLGGAERTPTHVIARAPHLSAPVQIDLEEFALLLRFSETLWHECEAWANDTQLVRLVELGLLVEHEAESPHGRREQAARASYWDTSALNQLQSSRWKERDYADPETRQWQDIRDIVASFGPPPDHALPRSPVDLPAPSALPNLCALVERRRTARNFDESRALRLCDLAALLWAGAGELGREAMAEGTDAVRRAVPSGGALHPLELWVLAQRVEGLEPGLYRYTSRTGQLDAAPPSDALPENFAYRALAGQTWFSNAPVLFLLCCNFARHLHKYRQHPKALRVLHVEVGHVAQNLYLAAAELGLGCYITLAINESLIDECLQFDGIQQGVLAIAGAGYNQDRGPVPELWPDAPIETAALR